MKETLLANLRFISLPSQKSGKDWFDLAREIDTYALENGFELSEESVFLVFDRSPGAIASGEGSCSVSRPVIGPLKELPGELQINDWTQKTVFEKEIRQDSWQELWQEAQSEWEELQRQGKNLRPSFMVRFSRRLAPDLTLKTHIYYHV